MADELLLKMSHIRKTFPGVVALDDMHLELKKGEVLALLGENGAGKSTLIKILSGIYGCDEGEIVMNGQPLEIHSVKDASEHGIRTIHQELVFVPSLSVAENIFIGNLPGKGIMADRELATVRAQKMLDDFGLDVDARTQMDMLTVAKQQMVEITKAVSFNAQIIIMDEPTSSISDKETEALFEKIRELKKKGIGIIYISHRMSELFEIADRVQVMRDGQYVDTKVVAETNVDELVALMVGREMTNYYTRDTDVATDEVVLEVKNLKNKALKDVSFQLHKGEILGFAGLVGAGRTETMHAIFGIDPLESGEILLDGQKLNIKEPKNAIDKGICLIPEDRKAHGIFPVLPLRTNLTIKVMNQFIKGISVDSNKERAIALEQFHNLGVKAPSIETAMMSLSGGNQQKVIIGSWVAAKPKILIMDEPTRGIDVGAKAEIYSIMNELTKQGVSIIMVSSELPEIINMSDRVIVMREGAVSGVLNRDELTQEVIMRHSVSV